jgi:hypothetical protein
VQVGRLTVRAAGSSLGHDVVARLRAEALVASLDLVPPGLDRSVLIVRRVQWRADQRLAEQARATVDELRRTAARPARSAAPGSGDAVLFADDAELLACLTRDALAGQLTRWYWRQLGPTGLPRIGAVLAAAWTERVRWLPAALAALPAEDATRAVSTLTPGEATRVRQAMLAEFTGPAALPGLGRSGRPDTVTPGPTTPAGPQPSAAGELTGSSNAAPARPVAPWLRWLRPAQPLQPEQEALLGTAIALHARPVLARRAAFTAQVEAWLHLAAHPAAEVTHPTAEVAQPPAEVAAARAGQRPIPGAGAATPAAVPGSATASAGPADIVAPATGDAGTALAPGHELPAAPDEPLAAPVPAAAAKSGAPRPASAAVTVASGLVSQFASVLYLINLLYWLDLPGAWPEGAAPGGWAVVELLARHLLTADAAPREDPLWRLLAELDGREPGSCPEVSIGADDPVRLPAAWLRRWAPSPACWGWTEQQGRMLLADRGRGFALADVPCLSGQGAAAAAAEHARLHAAGVSGSLRPLPPLQTPMPTDAGGPQGWAQWRATVGQFVAWLLASRDVQASALAQPGRIAVTRTHVDVVLDIEHVDMAARVCGLDRDPGWVPDLGRIVLFHFEGRG